MDRGDETVTDPGEAGRLRVQAARIYVESLVGAALVTGLGLLAAVWLAGR